MADATLLPNGDGTIVGWTSTEGTIWEAIDETIAAADTSTFVNSADGENDDSFFVSLTSTPENFEASNGTVSVEIRAKNSSDHGNEIDSFIVQIFASDESTPLSAESSFIDTSVDWSNDIRVMSVTGTDDKATWDGAVIKVFLDGRGNNGYISVTALDVTLSSYKPKPKASLHSSSSMKADLHDIFAKSTASLHASSTIIPRLDRTIIEVGAVFGKIAPSVNTYEPVKLSSPLNRGLVSWWLALPQGQWAGGLSVRDLMNRHHMTLQNSSQWSGPNIERKGGFGRIEYDGSSEYASTPGVSSLSFGDGSADSPFTVMCWAFMNDASAFRAMTRNTASSVWAFGTSPTDNLHFICYDDSAGKNISASTTGTLTALEGTWVHIVGTYNGVGNETGLFVYVNGVQQAASQTTGGGYISMEPLPDVDLEFGRIVEASYADGLMDDYRIHNRELSAEEIQQIYTDSLNGYKDSLNVLQMNVGVYSVIVDGTASLNGSSQIAANLAGEVFTGEAGLNSSSDMSTTPAIVVGPSVGLQSISDISVTSSSIIEGSASLNSSSSVSSTSTMAIGASVSMSSIAQISNQPVLILSASTGCHANGDISCIGKMNLSANTGLNSQSQLSSTSVNTLTSTAKFHANSSFSSVGSLITNNPTCCFNSTSQVSAQNSCILSNNASLPSNGVLLSGETVILSAKIGCNVNSHLFSNLTEPSPEILLGFTAIHCRSNLMGNLTVLPGIIFEATVILQQAHEAVGTIQQSHDITGTI